MSWQPQCAECRHYDPQEGGAGRGLCRQQPPAVVVRQGKVAGQWPPVLEDDWCGAFEARAAKFWHAAPEGLTA